jgi:hypothetical protein
MPTREDWLKRIRAAMARGEYLLAYDEATTATAEFPDDPLLQHQTVLSLARSGATDRALEVLEHSALEKHAATVSVELQEDIAALRARLAKDRALNATGSERERRARDAAGHYETTYERLGRAYSCVNAATMWLLAGDDERATRLARATRDACRAAGPPRTQADAYWRAATEAEAALLLDDMPAVETSLERAAGEAADDLAAVGVTRKQLLLICALKGLPPELLDPLAVPGVIHYGGHRIAGAGEQGRFPAEAEGTVAEAIAKELAREAVGFAYGSLASGADILFAEALLAQGAELHVMLPFETEEFSRISVEPAGAGWVERFRRCLERATSVSHATPGAYLNDVSLFDYCSRLGMGHAVIRAEFLGATPRQIVVWDGAPAAGEAGTARDVETWRSGGRETSVVAVRGSGPPGDERSVPSTSGRALRAMLFADVKGFSRLPDTLTMSFVRSVMGPLGTTLDGFDAHIQHRNSWGDGLYVVLDEVSTAAHCALALQATMKTLDLDRAGLPFTLGLRVGAHVGPVFEARDPIRNERNFYGVEVTRTARIEPRTPEGDVYVTDPFAAMTALEAESNLSCQYVGHIPTAKDYGTFPMYVLKHR